MKKKEQQQKMQHSAEGGEGAFKKDSDPKKRNEMNLDLDYWKKRFLYPYALDTAPLRHGSSGDSNSGTISQQDLN